ncbi:MULTISPECIES: CoA-disulfide reductase [Clostridium]|uniref:CoA-disulfide reductase n=1 Tax=Clostridium TaxID=1485 RepID=UPI0005C1F717|nr:MULTISPECIES: CoA-disulfide reductase [Clostridium]AXB85768.1 CoA-disulfide reductase [Clostridium butyricum]KIU08957.1 NADH oxidase [Clostridium butyricum]KQB78350.1 CoA-disulfide reductase [Clostridium butyricum]MBA8965287.1 NADPH-dependent 2,4-dienoyl-CoA reductase/sulfur reductase-like enzyme [Clostridium butyricum]MBA8970156.1 NADPH-dependent 2,4-dienoyl-CoA reductase/sulfur reductase-like enzyme [Clostridium butyricum]
MRVIIIGGIAAGTSAAAKFRRLHKDAEIVIYEKNNIVSFGACGLPYFVGDFFEDSNNMIARTPEAFVNSGIDVKTLHEVKRVDFENKKVIVQDLKGNEEFEDYYDKLMIATGASSIIPPIKNLDIENVHTLKSMEDGIRLKELFRDENNKNIAIIGAGFIGLEAVEAAKKYGKKVSVFQLGDRILQDVFDKEITDLLEEELRSHNVDLYLQESVTEIIGDKKVKKVKTSNREVEADVVIIATGVRPNTEFLKNSNLEMLPNGAIIVDNYGKTSIEDVYSAGDCATITQIITGEKAYVPLATGANKLGRIVGENLAGADIEFQGSLSSSCIKVMNMEAGRTGITESKAKALNLNYKTVFINDMNATNYYPGQSKIYIKLIYDSESKVILGGQVAGYKDAVQRVNVIAACIYGKLTTKELGMLDLCYAPPFARTWDALNVAGNVCK